MFNEDSISCINRVFTDNRSERPDLCFFLGRFQKRIFLQCTYLVQLLKQRQPLVSDHPKPQTKIKKSFERDSYHSLTHPTYWDLATVCFIRVFTRRVDCTFFYNFGERRRQFHYLKTKQKVQNLYYLLGLLHDLCIIMIFQQCAKLKSPSVLLRNRSMTSFRSMHFRYCMCKSQ